MRQALISKSSPIQARNQACSCFQMHENWSQFSQKKLFKHQVIIRSHSSTEQSFWAGICLENSAMIQMLSMLHDPESGTEVQLTPPGVKPKLGLLSMWNFTRSPCPCVFCFPLLWNVLVDELTNVLCRCVWKCVCTAPCNTLASYSRCIPIFSTQWIQDAPQLQPG